VADEFIERGILIGLVTNKDYLNGVTGFWDAALLQSDTARLLAGWCLDYFHTYGDPPGRNLELIYSEHADGLSAGDASDIRETLAGLSEEYDRGEAVDPVYLLDQTRAYFRRQAARALSARISEAVEGGGAERMEEVERLIRSYSPPGEEGNGNRPSVIDPFGSYNVVRAAFRGRAKPLIRFGRALGKLWNSQFVRDAFVGLLAPEKRGKSWTLLEIGLKATGDGNEVAFFQAGDMSAQQQQIRIYTRISGKRLVTPGDEDEESGEFTATRNNGGGDLLYPVLDCSLNQTGQCTRPEREENAAPRLFSKEEWEDAKTKEATPALLKEATRKYPEWLQCRNCANICPSVWFQVRKDEGVLTEREAYRAVRAWARRHKGRFRLSTHVNESLSVAEIRATLDRWEREDGFKPDVIIIDYADILAPDPDCERLDWRHQVNKIWQRLRALSEQRHCLVITATQAAATSYDKGLLRLRDFSEDKRKYSHVTAMYGLNQTSEEKRLGILRINQLVVREGDFNTTNQVHVLQCLPLGRPIIGSW
jgi:hypothetical protein